MRNSLPERFAGVVAMVLVCILVVITAWVLSRSGLQAAPRYTTIGIRDGEAGWVCRLDNLSGEVTCAVVAVELVGQGAELRIVAVPAGAGTEKIDMVPGVTY